VASERVERIKSGYAQWSRRREATEGGTVAEFEFHAPPDLPGKDVYRGSAAMEEFSADLAEGFESLRIEPLSFEESGDRVLVAVHLAARGRTTRIDVEREEFHLWTWGPEAPIRLECFTTREEALAHAGGRFAAQGGRT
jgi:hypothetical protein